MVDATLNCLGYLIRMRPATSNRILNCVINFNPLVLSGPTMTTKTKILIKSIEKTTRMILLHILNASKRQSSPQPHDRALLAGSLSDPHNPMYGRIQQHLDRLARARAELFDDSGRKRALLESQAANGGHDDKRQRVNQTQAAITPDVELSPLPPGQHPLSKVFTLIKDQDLSKFDVSLVPPVMAARISAMCLAKVSEEQLMQAVDVWKSQSPPALKMQPMAESGSPIPPGPLVTLRIMNRGISDANPLLNYPCRRRIVICSSTPANLPSVSEIGSKP